MLENQDQSGIMALLANLARDTSQIKTDLAVNTTKTGYIEEHLRTLNGKVVKQEERQQNADKERGEIKGIVDGLVTSKRRWNDGLVGVLKQLAIFGLGILSAYIIFQLTH